MYLLLTGVITLIITAIIMCLGFKFFLKRIRIHKVDYMVVTKELDQPETRREICKFTMFYWNEMSKKNHIKRLVDECTDIRYGIRDENNTLHASIDVYLTDKDVHNLHLEYTVSSVKPK